MEQMYISRGEIHLDKSHVQLLREEPKNVKERYHAVVTTLSLVSRLIRQKVAQVLVLVYVGFKGLSRYLRGCDIRSSVYCCGHMRPQTFLYIHIYTMLGDPGLKGVRGVI
jgi:hypothetical protein